jgi:hypothetical protein
LIKVKQVYLREEAFFKIKRLPDFATVGEHLPLHRRAAFVGGMGGKLCCQLVTGLQGDRLQRREVKLFPMRFRRVGRGGKGDAGD